VDRDAQSYDCDVSPAGLSNRRFSPLRASVASFADGDFGRLPHVAATTRIRRPRTAARWPYGGSGLARSCRFALTMSSSAGSARPDRHGRTRASGDPYLRRDGDRFSVPAASRSRIVQGERPRYAAAASKCSRRGGTGTMDCETKAPCAGVPFTPTFASSMPALCPDFGSVRGRPGLWRAPRRRASPRPLPILGVLTRAPGGRCLRTRRGASR